MNIVSFSAGGQTLSISAPVAGYLENFKDWPADGAAVAQATRDLEPGAVCIDVGANVGVMALSLAARRPDVRVIAIEPVKHNVDCLRENVRANRLSNVEVIHAACSDRAGTVRMAANGPWSSVTTEGSEEVACVTLDDFADLRPAFIKIDVESWEPQVLAGGARLFATCSPTVLMEVNLWWILMKDQPVRQFLDAVWNGSDMLGVFDGDTFHPPMSVATFLYHHISSHKGVSDILFRPRGSLGTTADLIGLEPAQIIRRVAAE